MRSRRERAAIPAAAVGFRASALIMRLGHAYDSEEGRAFAAATTALMTGHAYATSQELARVRGTFERYEEHRNCMLKVIRMHRQAGDERDGPGVGAGVARADQTVYHDARRASYLVLPVVKLSPGSVAAGQLIDSLVGNQKGQRQVSGCGSKARGSSVANPRAIKQFG